MNELEKKKKEKKKKKKKQSKAFVSPDQLSTLYTQTEGITSLLSLTVENYKWATSQQNQQNECVPCEDSYQPGHLPSLIRVCCALNG